MLITDLFIEILYIMIMTINVVVLNSLKSNKIKKDKKGKVLLDESQFVAKSLKKSSLNDVIICSLLYLESLFFPFWKNVFFDFNKFRTTTLLCLSSDTKILWEFLIYYFTICAILIIEIDFGMKCSKIFGENMKEFVR